MKPTRERPHKVDYVRIDDTCFRGTCRTSKKSYLHWTSYLRDGDVLVIWEGGDPYAPTECFNIDHVNAREK